MPTDIDILRKIDRIHPYPAKFPVDLAMNYISKYTNIGNTVYDPFVGSGTTLLASRALERNAYGTDVNHIAVLISQFKLLSLSQNDIKELWDFIARFENSFFDIVKTVPRFYYKSIDHWFCADAITVLSVIKSEISKLGKNEQKIFCNLVFSSIINTVSNQESDTRYAAIIKPNLNIQHIFDVFVKKFKTILSLFEIYNEKFIMKSNCEVLLSDSQYCNQILKLNSVDLILTSPPYPNTYDYYLYHKHRMNWLECDVKYSMETEIGSRREYSSLKKPQEKFSEDLFIIFNSCNDVLKQNGHVVIVMGDGKIQGKTYEAKENIERICYKFNWLLTDYSYTYLDQTSKSFQQSYRTKGKKNMCWFLKRRNRMKIEQIRVYAEVLEQGIDFKEYIENSGIKCSVINIYSHKARGEISETDSIVTRIRKSKDVDVLITAISDCKEYPLLMVEYSTAVPADDHIMQRSDVYYWGAIYRVPVMKIYPLSKGMNQDFGGGDKIKPEDEMLISKRFGAIFYPIFWNTI